MALDIGTLTGYLALDNSGFVSAVKDSLGELKSGDWKKAGKFAGVASAGALAAGFASEINMQQAVNRTSAQLGLTKEEAAKVGAASGQLYRDGLGSSMEEVSAATGSVIGAFGDLRSSSQADIEEAAKSALQFSSVMGVDVGEAAKTAGVLVETGLADNALSAFDLMTKASQKVGPDMVDPLLDATNEYSKHFAMLGMDGDQAMSVLAEAASGGEIAIDKAGDAAKEFGIRATDLGDKGAQEALEALGLSGEEVANGLLAGGESAQEMTGKVTDALLSIEDPAKQAELASGLFGTQIEDIGKDNLPGYLEALGAAEGAMGDVEGATRAMGETMTDDAGTSLKQFGRMVQSELMELAAPLAEFLTPLLDNLGKLQPAIVPIVVALGGFAAAVWAVNAAQTAWLAITRAVTAAKRVAAAAQWAWNAALSANPIGLVITAIGLLVAALVWFFTKTETGQAIWARVWGGIKSVAAGVADWFTGTLVPLLQAAWEAVSAAMTWLYESVIKPVWQAIKTAIVLVIAGVMTYIDLWVAIYRNVLAPAMTWLYESVIKPVWQAIKTAIVLVIAGVMTYIDLWVAIYRNVLAPAMTWLYESVIKPVWQAIKTAIAAVVSWFQGTAVPFIQSAIRVAQAAHEAFRTGLQVIWNAIRARVIQPVLTWFQTYVVGGFKAAISLVKAGFDAFRAGLAVIWSAVRNRVIAPVLSWFQTYVVGGFKAAISLVKAGFDAFRAGLAVIWSAVRNRVIDPVVSWFKGTVVAAFVLATRRVRIMFDQLRAGLAKAWAAIRNRVIEPVYSWFRGTVVGGLKKATDKIENAFNTMKDGVGKAWDAVKSKAKAPIRFVVDTVINKGIVSNFNKIAGKFGVKKLPSVSVGFASGGVLPGYTPGRDVHSFYSPNLGRLDLSGGEAIMRPEWTRAVGGPAAVDRMNREARAGINTTARRGGGTRSDAFASGGVWGARHGYAGGGVLNWIKDKTSDAAKWATDKAAWVKAVVADPLGSFKKLTSGLLGSVPEAGLMTDVAKGMANKIASGIGNHLKGKGTDGSGGSSKMGTGGSLGWAAGIARKHGLTMTSGYRPGARTSSGSLSMHGANRARDYSNSTGPTPQMMAFFNEILAGSKPTELLYTPAGARNVHRGGRQYANTGTVKRIHYNHVHVAYKDGGLLPDDLGKGLRVGTLAASPGWHMVGEDGPELLRMRGGEQVKTTRDTAAMLRSDGLSEEDVQRIATAVRDGARDGSREGVGDGLSGSASRARTTARMGAA